MNRIKLIYLQQNRTETGTLVGTGGPAPCRLGAPRPMSLAVKSPLSCSETG